MLLAGVLALSACGSSPKTNAPVTSTTPSSTQTTTSTRTTTTSVAATTPSALQAEATAAAAGDIPDNQTFIVFGDPAAGYSMKYPEGWAQQGSGTKVMIRDKNNIVRVVVAKSAAPTAAGVRKDLAGLKGAHVAGGPQAMTISGASALKAVYTTVSAPNPVTGKRVTLVVDRYYLAHKGKEAIVDLGSPQGVDNVDAYRLMIESFRWR